MEFAIGWFFVFSQKALCLLGGNPFFIIELCECIFRQHVCLYMTSKNIYLFWNALCKCKDENSYSKSINIFLSKDCDSDWGDNDKDTYKIETGNKNKYTYGYFSVFYH